MSETLTMDTSATQIQPPPIVATPTFRKSTVADRDRVQSMTIHTSQNVILTKNAAPAEGANLGWELVYTQDHWVTVQIVDRANMDVTVHADQVLIYGDLCLPGRSLTIVARTVLAKHEQDDNTSPVVIDVSGANGTPKDKVPVGQGPLQLVNGKPIGKVAPQGPQGHGTRIKTTMDGGLFYSLEPTATSNGGPGWGSPDHHEMNGGAIDAGAPGDPGGTITIVTDLLQGLALDLRANGGDGAHGQDGQDGVKGGQGGTGGPVKWLNTGDDNLAASDGGTGGKGGNGGVGGEGGPGGASGHITVVASAQVVDHGIHHSLEAGLPGQHGIDGTPGEGGEKGPGGEGYHGSYSHSYWAPEFLALILPDGHEGGLGQPGDSPNTPLKTFSVRGRDWRGLSAPVVPAPGTPTVTWGEDASIETLATVGAVDWLQMMVEKVRLTSMTTDPADLEGYADLGVEVDWLVSILSLRDTRGGPDSVTVKAALHSAWAMSRAHLMGQDGFGMGARWVPSMSVGTYLTRGVEAVEVLKDLEAATASFWSAAASAEQAQAGLTMQSQEITDSWSQVDQVATQARKAMTDVRTALDAAEIERNKAKSSLAAALSSFSGAIESSFSLDPSTLLNCLSQMSFAGGSFAGSAGLIGSQAGLAITDAEDNIRDDAGQKVSKQYLVSELTSFIGQKWDVSVKESRDGFLDNSSTYAFLDEASRVASLIDSYAQHPDLARDENQTAQALAKYVDMVDRRNALIDQYNDSVRRVIFLKAQSDRLTSRAGDIATQVTAGSNDATRAWADYYNGLTSGVREICLENLARAYRAAAFWCLSDIASFNDWVQGNPGAVTAKALEAGFRALQTALDDALDTYRRTPGLFPPAPIPGEVSDGWTPGGVVVVLTPEAHPWLFRQLHLNYLADFEILPATKRSYAPATLDTPCDAVRRVPITAIVKTADDGPEPVIANPFFERANVRLRTVRPWLEGMPTTSGNHMVVIEHLGQERFRTVDDQPFPVPSTAGPYLDHDPATITFSYNAAEYRFDPKLGFAAAALHHGADQGDGSLVFNKAAEAAGATLPDAATYAPIGPFGVWRLRIDPKDNPGADLKTIRRIIIDFQGCCDTPFS